MRRPRRDPTCVYGSAHDDQMPPDSERRARKGDQPGEPAGMPSKWSKSDPQGRPFKNLRSRELTPAESLMHGYYSRGKRSRVGGSTGGEK